jgi:Holin of 3TMs, for gene-transfer release
MAAADPITAALNIGSALIDRLFPDPAQQADARLKLLALQQSGELAALQAASNIITAEASSDSWLAKSWRPILMLTFGVLIVARWFGWAAPNLTEAEYLKLWDIVQLGLGGYVIGRSVEKTVPAIASAIQSNKS